MTPIVADVPDVASLFEQINTPPGTWHAATIWQMLFFSVPISKVQQKQFAFSWKGQQYTFTVLPPRFINPPDPRHHNLVRRALELLSFPQDSTLVHYSDDITLTGPSEQKVATALYLLVRLVCQMVANGSDKNFRAFYLSDISGVQWYGHVELSLSR